MSDHYMRSGGRWYRLEQQNDFLFFAKETDKPMPDWVARIYIMRGEATYRIKVFNETLSIERQPGGPNTIYSLADEPARLVYDVERDAWNNAAIDELIERYISDSSDDELARQASADLPTVDDVRAANPRADGYFIVRYDGGGEFVLWFIDYNGSQSGDYGRAVERHIHTYKEGAPEPATAAADARRWLADNAHWL